MTRAKPSSSSALTMGRGCSGQRRAGGRARSNRIPSTLPAPRTSRRGPISTAWATDGAALFGTTTAPLALGSLSRHGALTEWGETRRSFQRADTASVSTAPCEAAGSLSTATVRRHRSLLASSLQSCSVASPSSSRRARPPTAAIAATRIAALHTHLPRRYVASPRPPIARLRCASLQRATAMASRRASRRARAE